MTTVDYIAQMNQQLVLCPKCGESGSYEIYSMEGNSAVDLLRTVCKGCGNTSRGLYPTKQSVLMLLDEWASGGSAVDDEVKYDSKELTILSFGVGQDSVALLYMYAYDETFRAKYAPGRFVCVFSDTGNEHPETYKYLEYVKNFCSEQGIEFHHLTPDMGYHNKGWGSLTERMRKDNSLIFKAGSKSCTDQLKITPIGKFVEDWLGKTYDFETGRKKAHYAFAKKYGKVNLLIGIAAGEEKRVAKAQNKEKWRRECVNTLYPLVDMGLDRGGCQSFIRNSGHPVPMPSNCLYCPFLSEQELVWLYRNYPEHFEEWCELEQNKLNNPKFDTAVTGKANYGVWGKRTLREVLKDALEKYGDWDDEKLNHFKMTHGHCVASQY